ncbi:GNAT family N-acetyltransferase [Paenibacillus phoenicis]|uniref:GNAT family N-acetyltransferase n=1 Tax=Paenibacillus phoenicis TaxID=554117 RepID=A0ABU5PMA8_9BACL|nr:MULTISPECIES: GNAT family N-acetyltransferase [Paenibacillus]EES72921.1 acetyltransferase, GNAT family [Paenibacillus sp. oral taxon 786 str. D14]MCT2194713.1 GNAT family N-acetyltransferase [Paenibacillus sp. p3-SID1389]MEA3570887.1 GNAT family N-acetyltransferase [Paenibacillus phoenicis]
MKIRLLKDHEDIPLDLLLLADPSQEMIEEYLQRGQCYVGLHDRDKVIAVIVLLQTRPGTLEIVNIAVREDFQGRGIGKKLIHFAIDKAREQNVKTIEIGTGNSSIGQLFLYQKCGFRITGIDRDFFIRHYPEKIYENGIQCRDMIRLSLDLIE